MTFKNRISKLRARPDRTRARKFGYMILRSSTRRSRSSDSLSLVIAMRIKKMNIPLAYPKGKGRDLGETKTRWRLAECKKFAI